MRDSKSVEVFFQVEKPDYVVCAAATVGGILANSNYPVQFLENNLYIQNNILHFSNKYNVKKLILLGSACIYPKYCDQPIKETSLMTGPLEPTNDAYGVAKIAGIKLCESYYRQYGKNFFSLMPNNLYGKNDNFDLESSHVIPAIMKKIHHAKINSQDEVEIWGSGNQLREFLHVQDLAEAILFIMENINADDIYSKNISVINIGSNEEISIKDLAFKIKSIIGYEGELAFDCSKPDGMPRKLLDNSILNNLGWSAKISLQDGLENLYKWYVDNC